MQLLFNQQGSFRQVGRLRFKFHLLHDMYAYEFNLLHNSFLTVHGVAVTVRYDTEIFRGGSGFAERVWKELCYREVEMLGDVEELAELWWYN